MTGQALRLRPLPSADSSSLLQLATRSVFSRMEITSQSFSELVLASWKRLEYSASLGTRCRNLCSPIIMQVCAVFCVHHVPTN